MPVETFEAARSVAEHWRAELGDSLTKRQGSANRQPGMVERVP